MPDPLKNAHYRYPGSEHSSPLSGLHTGDDATTGEPLDREECDAVRHPEPETEGFDADRVSVWFVVLLAALVAILVLANTGIIPLSGKVGQ